MDEVRWVINNSKSKVINNYNSAYKYTEPNFFALGQVSTISTEYVDGEVR